MPRVIGIIQARSSSTRLPQKVLMQLGPGGESLLEVVVTRASMSRSLSQLVLATTTEPEDDELCRLALSLGLGVTRGHADDVLARFFQAADEHSADFILRLTADDPFKDPGMIDSIIELALETNSDYLANNFGEHLPEGLDLEIFSRKALQLSNTMAKLKWEREHLTQWMRNSGPTEGLRINEYKDFSEWPSVRLTVDYFADLNLARHIYAEIKQGLMHSSDELRQYLLLRPELCAESFSIAPRNQGLKISQTEETT